MREKSKNRGMILFCMIFLVAGIVLAGMAVIIYFNNSSFKSRAVKIPATIERIDSYTTTRKSNRGTRTKTNHNVYVSYEFNSDVASGLVIRQSVPAKTEVKEGTTIDIVISNGAETKTYKGTVSGSISTTDEVLANSTVTVNVYINDDAGYHLAYTVTQSGASIPVSGSAGGLEYNNGTVSYTVVNSDGADVSTMYTKSLTLSYENE